MAEVDKGNVYPVDLRVNAVLHRSTNLVRGFALLIEQRNFICAAPLLRLQIDNCLRLLCALSRACDAAAMVKEVKRGSSLWLKTKSSDLADGAWQNGYGIFSIAFSQIESVREYIAGVPKVARAAQPWAE